MPPDLHVELAAEPGAAGRSRRVTGQWLASLCGVDETCDTASDLVLAVNEAVSNSIEHGYAGDPRGTITLRADARCAGDRPGCSDLRVRVEVSDRGVWREPPGEPGYRGRGLSMIRACTDEVVIEHGNAGTTVTFSGTLGRCARAGR